MLSTAQMAAVAHRPCSPVSQAAVKYWHCWYRYHFVLTAHCHRHWFTLRSPYCSVLLHWLTCNLQAKADLAASSLERDTCLSLAISKCDQLGHARCFTLHCDCQQLYHASAPMLLCQRDTLRSVRVVSLRPSVWSPVCRHSNHLLFQMPPNHPRFCSS